MALFNLDSVRSKIQLAPPTKKIYLIYDGHNNSEMQYLESIWSKISWYFIDYERRIHVKILTSIQQV